MLSMEGLEPLEGDPEAFEDWYRRGVRMASLTWNHANEFAGGIETPAQGLTDRGRALVRRFGELGVVLDLAHASEQTWRDVLEDERPLLGHARRLPRRPSTIRGTSPTGSSRRSRSAGACSG